MGFLTNSSHVLPNLTLGTLFADLSERRFATRIVVTWKATWLTSAQKWSVTS